MSKTYYIKWEAYVVYKDGHTEGEMPMDSLEVDEDYIDPFIEFGETEENDDTISERDCERLIEELRQSNKFHIDENTLIQENSDYDYEDVEKGGINIIIIESEDGDILYKSDVSYV